jgi:hypothetical protein
MSIDLSERAYAMDTADKLLVRHSRPIDGSLLMARLSEQQTGRFTLSISTHPARYTE